MIRFYATVFFIFIWNIISVNAQNQADTANSYTIIGLKAHYGFIILHSKQLSSNVYSNPIGVEADLSWHYNKKSAYDYCNCYPRLGLSINYWDFQNPDVLGHAVTLIGYVEPFLSAQRKFSLSFRLGGGLSYQDNPYNPETNPDNLSYSTQFAVPLLVSLNFNYRISKRMNLNFGLNYNHISNGGVKLPNKGLNYPTASVGLDFSRNDLHFQDKRGKTKITRDSRIKRIDLGTVWGLKGVPGKNRQYLVSGFYGKRSWQAWAHSAFVFGVELNYHWTRTGGTDDDPFTQFAFTGGYEQLMGRFLFAIEMGAYLQDPVDQTLLYQRYSLRFQINRLLFTGISFKAHGHVADYFGIMAGITIQGKKIK